MSEQRTRCGRSLDCVLRRWADVVHSQRTFTVAVNGPADWKGSNQVDLMASLKFKKPVLLRFILNDQPPRSINLEGYRQDYMALKSLNMNQDFLFVLVRKDTGAPGGFRTLTVNQDLNLALRTLLELQGKETLLQPEAQRMFDPDIGLAAAAAAAAFPHHATTFNAFAEPVGTEAFVQNFRVLCLAGDVEDRLGNLPFSP